MSLTVTVLLYGKRGEVTWQAWVWPATLLSRATLPPVPTLSGYWPIGLCLGTCPLPLLEVRCCDKATHLYNIGLCVNCSCVLHVRLFAVIMILLGDLVGAFEWIRMDPFP